MYHVKITYTLFVPRNLQIYFRHGLKYLLLWIWLHHPIHVLHRKHLNWLKIGVLDHLGLRWKVTHIVIRVGRGVKIVGLVNKFWLIIIKIIKSWLLKFILLILIFSSKRIIVYYFWHSELRHHLRLWNFFYIFSWHHLYRLRYLLGLWFFFLLLLLKLVLF